MKKLSIDVAVKRRSMVNKVFGELIHPPRKEKGNLEKVDSDTDLQFRVKRNSSKYDVGNDERRASGGGGRRSSNFYGNYGIINSQCISNHVAVADNGVIN